MGPNKGPTQVKIPTSCKAPTPFHNTSYQVVAQGHDVAYGLDGAHINDVGVVAAVELIHAVPRLGWGVCGAQPHILKAHQPCDQRRCPLVGKTTALVLHVPRFSWSPCQPGFGLMLNNRQASN